MARREPTIDGGEKIVGRFAFALIAPEPRPAGTDATPFAKAEGYHTTRRSPGSASRCRRNRPTYHTLTCFGC